VVGATVKTFGGVEPSLGWNVSAKSDSPMGQISRWADQVEDPEASTIHQNIS
jgi:hypothetical protein